MKDRLAWLLAGVVAVVPACSSEEGGAEEVVALYEETAQIAPFPSDRLTRPDPSTRTGRRLAVGDLASAANPFVPAFAPTASDLDALDGFSTIGGAFLRFGAELDVEELLTRSPADFTQAGTPIALVDVDPASPARGRAMPIVVEYLSSSTDDRAVDPDFTLLVQPAVPLEPRTRYLLVATGALRSASGAPVRPSPATRALLSGDAEGEYGAALRASLPLVETATGIRADDVVVATMFTTGTVHDDLAAVAAAVRASPPPSPSTFTLSKESTEGDERVRFVGSLSAPEHRGPDGRWHMEGGRPAVQSTTSIETFLTFTKGRRSGPRPVVVFGHGLGRDKDMSWELAQHLAELDVAIVAIDAPEHGSRHDPPFPPGGTEQASATLSFIGVDLAARSIDIGKARDNFRQLTSDQLHLFHWLSTLANVDVLPVGAPDGIPDVDPTRVVYMGVSFGAVVGSTVLAFVPEARAACLTVGGAPLGTILRDSQTLRLLVNNLFPETATETDFIRFVTMAQGIVDPGDPVNYAPYVASRPLPGVPGWRGTDVLVQEAIQDGIIPNRATEILARALGLVQVEPVIAEIPGLSRAPAPLASSGDRAVAGLLQLDRAGGEPVNHRTFFGTPEARRQYVDFLRSALEGTRAVVR